MKRIIVYVLAAVMIVTLAGCACSSQQPAEESGTVMTAVITEINGNSLLVTPVEGSEELNSSDCFDIPSDKLDQDSEPEVGDTVRIAYSGGILETYPAGLEGITSVTIVE